MSRKSRAREKIRQAVESVIEAVRRLTPLERVEVLVLLLWPFLGYGNDYYFLGPFRWNE